MYQTVMSQAHSTVRPEQTKTDTFAVFADNPQDPHSDLVLLKRVEVPRYPVPEAGAERLSFDQRLQMAVQWAVAADDTSVPPEMVEGQEFMVMHDLDEPMEFARFQRNPTVAGCWNPNEESVGEFADR